jgi:hypothetical protein
MPFACPVGPEDRTGALCPLRCLQVKLEQKKQKRPYVYAKKIDEILRPIIIERI